MAVRLRDCFFCARPVLFVWALFLGALVSSGVAHADSGTVVLRSGARVEGDVVGVVPGDRVIVVLPDGSSMTFVWADVLFVFDGPRLYDSAGHSTTIARGPSAASLAPVVAIPSPSAAATPIAAPPEPATPTPFDPRTAFMPSIPRLAGTRTLFGFGGFFFMSGLALFITQGAMSSSNDPGLVAMIFTPPATVGVAVGAGLWARGARRMAIRRQFLRNPRSRDVLFGRRIDVRLGVATLGDTLVPQLTLQF